MKVYTRKGDSGETSLIGGTRVSKADARIDAYGTVDELNSCIGLIRDSCKAFRQEDTLIRIQNQLFNIGSQLASDGNNKMILPGLEQAEVDELEQQVDKMEQELPELKNFILPGGNSTASFCHLARCVCRRAERKVVSLSQVSDVDALIINYLNRLSDYLFVLARFATKEFGGEETLWKPRQ